MSLYHLGSLATFAYIGELIVFLIASKFLFIPIIEDTFARYDSFRRDLYLFLASLLWVSLLGSIIFNTYRLVFNLPKLL